MIQPSVVSGYVQRMRKATARVQPTHKVIPAIPSSNVHCDSETYAARKFLSTLIRRPK